MNIIDPNQQMQTYPFPSTSASTTDSGVNQTFNIQPTANSGQPQGEVQAMKKGGKVKAKSKVKPKCMARGGGCEVRGKTKGRFV